MKKFLSILQWCLLAAALSILVFYFARVFVCDRFKISGDSMSPTLENGRYVYVNKLLMGARIYTCFDFDSPDMKCFRMPGLRRMRVGDIAVFNYPYGRIKGKISFKINYVYAKRCAACPGDTLYIENAFYRNSRTGCVGVPDDGQNMLSRLSDGELDDWHIAMKAFSYAGDAVDWTIRDMGPLYVPGKGDTVLLDHITRSLYLKIIEYENGTVPAEGESYVFRNNYYFMAGDNVLNSRDSRYLGLIPEDYFVGVVAGVRNAFRN